MDRFWKILAGLEAILIALLAWTLFAEEGREADLAPAKDVSPEQPARSEQALDGVPLPLVKAADGSRVGMNGPSTVETLAEQGDPLGVVVYGVVRSEEGAPIDAAYVGLWRDAERAGLGQSAEGGSYAIAGMAPGTYEVRCTVTGYAPWMEEFTVQGESGFARLDLVLQPSLEIRIRFETPEGMSLRQALTGEQFAIPPHFLAIATAEAILADLPPMPYRFERYGLGNYLDRWDPRVQDELTDHWDGMLFVNRPPPFAVHAMHRHRVLASRSVGAVVEEIVFVVDPGKVLRGLASLRVQVLDGVSGRPIEGARLWYGTSQSGSSVRSDEDGVARVEHLPSGSIELSVHAEGRGRHQETVVLAPGEARDLGEVALYPAATVTGRVIDAQGRPVTGAILRARNLDSESAQFPDRPRSHTRVDGNGRFSMGGLAPGRTLLWAQSRESGLRSRPVMLVVEAGSEHEVEILAESTTPVSVEFEVPDGQAFFLGVFAGGTLEQYTTVYESRKVTLNLLRGSYELRLYDHDRVWAFTTIEVGHTPLATRLVPP